MQGRPLDIIDESNVLEGETSCLFISRSAIFADAMEEIKYIDNIRFPIEICFHGEGARDYGGPRKEFFTLLLKEIGERMLEVNEATGKKTLIQNEEAKKEAVARHHFYYGGLFIGIVN